LETASLEDFYRLYEEVQAIDTNGAFRIMQFYAFYWDHKVCVQSKVLHSAKTDFQNVALSNKLFTAYIDQLKVALKHTDYKPHWLARGMCRLTIPLNRLSKHAQISEAIACRYRND